MQGLVEQFSQSVLWLWSEQGGSATCSGACEAPPDAGSNTTRQQSLSTPSMPVQTETEEHVRGKKALKKHLQRSIDKLVAAKEQLLEEEGREVAQGITDRIKALQLQKDGLMSVAARKKKAFAQLEESEKTLESKRKAPQQAQEALEEGSRKHAAAQEACASVEHEIEEEEDQDEEMHDEDQNNTRDPYRDWYNWSDCTSQSREFKEMRTAISQISDTLALLLKTFHPVAVEVGTTVKMPQTLALQTGVHVEETASCEGLTESRVPATPKQLPTVPEEEQDLLGTTPVGNSAEDVTNALNPFRSTSERHRPY